MRGRRVRIGVIVAAATILGAAAWWVIPGSPAAGQQAGCTLDPDQQPAEPLEMNTVLQGSLFKTVVMEKEIFICRNEAGAPERIHDVETFIEIIERITNNEIRLVQKRVEVATCVKDMVTGSVTCGVKDLQLPVATFEPLEGCSPESRFRMSDPVEMNTVAPVQGPIKTIKVEKEVFDCGPTVRDLYLFTEIHERQTTAGTNIRPFRKLFEGVVCFKIPAEATVDRCFQFVPKQL